MTTAMKAAPGSTAADWKRFVIVALCVLTLLSLLFVTQLNAVDRKTDEAVSFTGFDFLLGNTPAAGKSAGSPHPMVIGAILFALIGIVVALFAPDKFVYSIVSGLFLAVTVFMFRFDITYQAKGEFGLVKDSLVFTIGWMAAMGLSVLNLIVVVWPRPGPTPTFAPVMPCLLPGISSSRISKNTGQYT